MPGCQTLWGPGPIRQSIEYEANIERSKTFVVVPFNSYLNQVQFAGSIERILVENGLSVISTPKGGREIEIRKGASESGAYLNDSGNIKIQTESAQQTSKAERIERYIELNDTNATYIVNTMCSYKECQVKFTEKDTGIVLGVYEMINSQHSISKKMLAGLNDIGFIKEKESATGKNKNVSSP